MSEPKSEYITANEDIEKRKRLEQLRYRDLAFMIEHGSDEEQLKEYSELLIHFIMQNEIKEI
jgi:hypothetical protein